VPLASLAAASGSKIRTGCARPTKRHAVDFFPGMFLEQTGPSENADFAYALLQFTF